MATDIKNSVKVGSSLRPASRTAAVNGAGVDRTGFEGVAVVLDLGAIGGTATPTFTFKVQDSADDSTFADVAAADLDAGQPAAFTAGDSITEIGYRGSKRFVRAAITVVSGTSPTLLCSATVVLAKPRKQPI